MKVALVNPSKRDMILSILPAQVEESRGVNPPLGILYLAAYLRAHTEHSVIVSDAEAEGRTVDEYRRWFDAEAPDVVGISAMTFTLIESLEIAQAAKDAGAVVVLGGPHVACFPEESAARQEVDYAIAGEGERSFAELVNALADGSEPLAVPGVYEYDDAHGRMQRGPGVAYLDDLDALPHPARDLTPVEKYDSILCRRTPVTTLMTSRGCPYRCTFCDRPAMGKGFRPRSAANVIEEIEACVALGVHEFLFYDDTFTVDRDRVVAICDEILARNIKIGWDIRARVKDVDFALLKLLRRAGCERVHFGVESGNPKILADYDKGITLADVRRAFKDANAAGLATLAYFMFGGPGETHATAADTMALAKDLRPDFIHFTALVPFPATKIYFDALERGIFATDHWREFARNPAPGYVPPVWEEHLTRDELLAILHNAYRTYYRRPAYLYQRLRGIRTFSELRRQTVAGMRILRAH